MIVTYNVIPDAFRAKLFKTHIQGAIVRSVASLIMWLFALFAFWVDDIQVSHFIGISCSVLFLILINPPTLFILTRIVRNNAYANFSLFINMLEVVGYTAIIYSLGGFEATYLTPIYAAMIAYLGVMAPQKVPFIIASFCALAFGSVVTLDGLGVIPSLKVDPHFNPSLSAQFIRVSVVIGLLFIVAYISSFTAGKLKQGRDRLRQQNKELEEKTIQLENSRRELNDAHNGLEVMVVKLQSEIAERKQAEEERLGFQQQLQQLQKVESLNRMAGAIAHHFNNQLHVVMGSLEMTMDGLPQGVNSNKSLVSAMQATRKAAEVSKLMLTYLGQTPGNHESIDLSYAYRQSLPLLQAAAPKGMTLKADFPSYGPVIRADSNQIHQILTNLVNNAWESNSNNRGTITLTVKTVSPTDIPTSKRFPIDWQPKSIPYACLEVSDTGCGISNMDIEKVFDPFFTTKFTGRGLGLPVVMGIVKAHGGGVTVESEQGQGSVFRIFLPVSTEEVPFLPDLPAIPEALQAAKAEMPSNIQGYGTVLLIEDEPQVRNMANIMLTRLGYTVLEAKDGIEAVEIFQQHQDEISCVLSDLTMPRMDGWETLAALRKLSPDIPVILSSGYDEVQVMAGEHPERPNAFLGKPYQIKGFRETINRVLAGKS
ncbi:MAG: ATP-binding protein [Desulfatirhabdiaceae bacterium]|nr:ATP-binding protein [Desulfatirhabdiaceae bacterium]